MKKKDIQKAIKDKTPLEHHQGAYGKSMRVIVLNADTIIKRSYSFKPKETPGWKVRFDNGREDTVPSRELLGTWAAYEESRKLGNEARARHLAESKARAKVTNALIDECEACLGMSLLELFETNQTGHLRARLRYVNSDDWVTFLTTIIAKVKS